MTYRKFGKNDILINTLKANPRSEFYIYSSSVYYNNRSRNQGQYNGEAQMVPDGFVNLYEYNIDKGASGVVYSSSDVTASGFFTGPGTNKFIEPYISKDSSRISLTMTTASLTSEEWGTRFDYGDKITGSYPQYASIRRTYSRTASSASSTNCNKANIDCNHNYTYMSLRSTLDNYGTLSEHFKVSSSYGNKDTQRLNIIQIPSIFYGQKIKKGSTSLKFYITGSLVGELKDEKKNGELIQVGPAGSPMSGTVAGVVLYEQGVYVLTASHALNYDNVDYEGDGSANDNPKWTYFGAYLHSPASINSGNGIPSTALESSFTIDYQGVTQKQTMTMMAHARSGDMNHSNNPTYKNVTHPNIAAFKSSSYQYIEPEIPIKNMVHTPLTDQVPQFQKETYITKVALYDEKKNLIGVAKVAVPVRKTEQRQYTFKLKLDI